MSQVCKRLRSWYSVHRFTLYILVKLTWGWLYVKQDMQCTYNVILRRVPATTVAVKNNNICYIFWDCVCSLRFPTCNAHASYCHLWPVRLYNILPHCLTYGKIFEKKKIHMKYVSWFSRKKNIWNMCFDFPRTFCLKRFSF